MMGPSYNMKEHSVSLLESVTVAFTEHFDRHVLRERESAFVFIVLFSSAVD